MTVIVQAQQPTPTPYQRKTQTGIVGTPAKQPDMQKVKTPARPDDKVADSVYATRIYGTIRWKKELGLPYAFNDDGSPSEDSCAKALFVLADTNPANDKGGFGARRAAKVAEENGYYLCRFDIPTSPTISLPFNRALVVTADIEYLRLTNNEIPGITKGMTWSGASQQLPPGYEDKVIDNPRTVTLTNAQPRAEVNFEISMAPASSSPLQRRASKPPR